jgi:ATP-dependent Clp protease protease subunit
MNFWAKANASKAELYLYDAIGADYFGDGITAKSVADALAEFKPNTALDIYVNSPGGSVFEGVAIYNQLLRWGGKKTVHIDGIAASIASVIAMAGDDIKIADSGVIMIHSAWGMTVGNAAEMRKYADSLEKVDGVIRDTYIRRTGSKQASVEQWMEAETWMNADEAVERGFATAKTGAKAVNASFAMLAKFRNTPESLKKPGLATRSLVARMGIRAQRVSK